MFFMCSLVFFNIYVLEMGKSSKPQRQYRRVVRKMVFYKATAPSQTADCRSKRKTSQ